jgi:hypothetical protein
MAQQTGNLNCAKERLKALLATSSPKEGWDILWKEQITPWDAKAFGSAPALVALAQEEGALPLGKALVPGCGSVCVPSFPSRICILGAENEGRRS